MRVPQRCEDRIGKSENQNVLRRLLAQEMVYPIGLLFGKRIVNDTIKLARRGEIGSERFFDDDAYPATLARLVQAGRFELLENRFELIWTCRTIKQAIDARA